MKTKTWPMIVTLLAALLLSACTIDITAVVNPDGSGALGMTYKLTREDLKSLEGMGMPAETICEQMGEGQEDFTFVREEHGEEVWCVASKPVATLQEMKTEMNGEGFTVNTLEMMGNQFTFDASADMSEQEGAEGFDLGMLQISYSMTAPGKVTSHNGDSIAGNTVTWELPLGSSKNLHLESKVGSSADLSLGGSGRSNTGLLIGLLLTCCCCLIVIVIIVVVVVVLMRRKQNVAG
ncbi:MAG: LppM family (lipo)protein [Chloroflexota bacterium]